MSIRQTSTVPCKGQHTSCVHIMYAKLGTRAYQGLAVPPKRADGADNDSHVCDEPPNLRELNILSIRPCAPRSTSAHLHHVRYVVYLPKRRLLSGFLRARYFLQLRERPASNGKGESIAVGMRSQVAQYELPSEA